MLSESVFSKQYWTEAVATVCYTQNRSTIVKIHLKTPYKIFRGRIPNIDILHVFGCLVYIHNHKDYLEKFDEKSNDVYFLGYSLVSKAFRVFNTKRKQTKETYHIIFDESIDAIKFTKPSDDNITIAESKRYAPDEYLDPYEPSQRYQTSEPISSPVEDASVSNTIPNPVNPSLSTPSMASPTPQHKWSQDKHIKLVNIKGNPGAEMLIRTMAKELSTALTHECPFVDFLSKEELKKVFEALKHPRWVDLMQEELNQFARNKLWTLVPAAYGKTIIGSK
nr:retrovirus-related Pol polyprotein from transposon TNT 1-94 [Tanacetum cinerariifolium]